ncbi:integrase catalytic domain-containing protein [Trichonephila inaurata madagascariensis]|uniref:Integrase catalytic domain-containing protein n=1 Tax=Trichonephila inaurata madagascariensis TaxID=2747483 RepID=A0A8X6Y5D4_9ARAC|nr:integrase catalytic domain-containing protein [Trichonephila inaurata madagascariensis]
MDALKLRRTPLRTAFTKAVNHLQEIIENDPVDMNAVETAFEQLKIKSAKLKEVEDAIVLDHQEINKRIRHVQTIREQLRKRFRIEYLGQLREQTQRHRKSRPLTVGEVVVVENSLKNRTLWSLARVIQLIPGKDGHVRVARVKTETGELVRPVQRLYQSRTARTRD